MSPKADGGCSGSEPRHDHGVTDGDTTNSAFGGTDRQTLYINDEHVALSDPSERARLPRLRMPGTRVVHTADFRYPIDRENRPTRRTRSYRATRIWESRQPGDDIGCFAMVLPRPSAQPTNLVSFHGGTFLCTRSVMLAEPSRIAPPVTGSKGRGLLLVCTCIARETRWPANPRSPNRAEGGRLC